MNKSLKIIGLSLLIGNLNTVYSKTFLDEIFDWNTKSNDYLNEFIDDIKQTKEYVDDAIVKLLNISKYNKNLNNINIFETKDGKSWGIELFIPGFKKNEIKVKINDQGILEITALHEIQSNKEDENKKYIYKSQSSKKEEYSRFIKLPQNVNYSDISHISVKYNEKNGKLEITFPLKKDQKNNVELKVN